MTHFSGLARLSSINGYTVQAAADKARFHRLGRLFLQRLADDIGLPQQTYELRSNVAGPAVSGEVTLHGETLHAWLQESCVGKPGVSLFYRTCKGRKDYCGGANHTLHLGGLTQASYGALVARCRVLASVEVVS